ncbi:MULTISPECIES: sigma-70 family RNA polymerase sigma factor [unclassified Isoptericola]|uniref:sigma-70 family RNA polymerase sigma factor n=1 Tax=unclassified Isoptericola TaxID=2623355 RepID=UPI0036687B5C
MSTPEHSSSARVTAASRADRAYLRAVADRILADPVEAEDAVQDAFARLATQDVEQIRDLRAWLVVAVRRLALDRVRSARGRRSEPRDPTGLAVADGAGGDAVVPDPADRVTLDDEVRRALAVVLDRLTPGERTVFVLHDVFGVPFDDVAEVVGRTTVACRQLASRARRAVRDGGPVPRHGGPETRDPELRDIVDRFVAACDGGDLGALARTLHPDVAGWATWHGERVGSDVGAARVAARTLVYLGPESGWTLTPLRWEDGMGVLAVQDGEPVAVVRLLVVDGRIAAVHSVLLRRPL